MSEPKAIWLQPWCVNCDNHIGEGRQWREDDVWGKCEDCGKMPVKYVLADEARAIEAERLLKRAREQLKADGDVLNRLLNEDILVSDNDRTEAAVQELYGSETQALIRAFLAKVKLGDEVEPQENWK